MARRPIDTIGHNLSQRELDDLDRVEYLLRKRKAAQRRVWFLAPVALVATLWLLLCAVVALYTYEQGQIWTDLHSGEGTYRQDMADAVVALVISFSLVAALWFSVRTVVLTGRHPLVRRERTRSRSDGGSGKVVSGIVGAVVGGLVLAYLKRYLGL